MKQIVREFEVKTENISIAIAFGIFDEPRIPTPFKIFWQTLLDELGHSTNPLDAQEREFVFDVLNTWCAR